jgi:biotin-(acetyl-CoA carboxylase) ligase
MMGSIAVPWADLGDPAVPLVPFAAGLATLDLVQSVLGDESGVGLGWPNDVIVKRDSRWRKLAGILVESSPLPDTSGVVVVVGVGLNIWPVVSAPSDVNLRAISLAELGPAEPNSAVEMPSNAQAFMRLESALRERIRSLRADRTAMMRSYRGQCLTVGQTVSFETSRGTRTGVANGVADTGEILIRIPGGIEAVSVGDVRVI